jgi:hypothetical protein
MGSSTIFEFKMPGKTVIATGKSHNQNSAGKVGKSSAGIPACCTADILVGRGWSAKRASPKSRKPMLPSARSARYARDSLAGRVPGIQASFGWTHLATFSKILSA